MTSKASSCVMLNGQQRTGRCLVRKNDLASKVYVMLLGRLRSLTGIRNDNPASRLAPPPGAPLFGRVGLEDESSRF
jgi:hypothetical protein